MPELKAPLRLTWDLPAYARLAATVWGRIVEARVLFLEVCIRPEGLGGLQGLVGSWGATGPKVSLLGEPECLLAALECLGAGALANADLRMLPRYRPELGVEDLASATRRLVPSLWSTPEGLGFFAEALEIALAYRLPTVAVLNPPAPALPLGPEDRAGAVSVWQGRAEGPLELEVHDLFLAEALGLTPFAGYAGCQAGGALGHVTEDGRLVACRTLPVDLGDLRDAGLRELWASPATESLRRTVARAPSGCADCNVEQVCRGGCPGLAGGSGRDASCPGPRGREGGARA